MLKTVTGYQGMVTAPHHLASQAGVSVLRDGGNAVEAMVAMAAAIAVVYPHMTAIGGDGFWLIAEPGKAPVGIDACGAAAGQAMRAYYTDQGFASIPTRGRLAALTAAGTISGLPDGPFSGPAVDWFPRRRWSGRSVPRTRLPCT